MKHFAFAIAVVAALGCSKKPNDAGGSVPAGSGSAATPSGSGSSTGSSAPAGSGSSSNSGSGGNVTGSGSSGSGSGSAAKSSDFDDKLDMPKQPARPKDQQDLVDHAADLLRALLAKAKTAKDAADVCTLLAPLGKGMVGLMKVKAPDGVSPDAFSDARADLFNQIDPGKPGWCDDPAHETVDHLQFVVSDIRDKFVAFVAMGAK